MSSTHTLPLWEMETLWFQPHINEFMIQTFTYKDWNQFIECKPYRIWKPYVLSSWAWKEYNGENHFQLVFVSPERFTGMNRAEIVVKKEEEPLIREWVKKHMPTFWKL
jgi:hypothetical protein